MHLWLDIRADGSMSLWLFPIRLKARHEMARIKRAAPGLLVARTVAGQAIPNKPVVVTCPGGFLPRTGALPGNAHVMVTDDVRGDDFADAIRESLRYSVFAVHSNAAAALLWAVAVNTLEFEMRHGFLSQEAIEDRMHQLLFGRATPLDGS